MAEYSANNTIYYSEEYINMPVIITASIICCTGIPLNGIVIWLLGFQIKRNPFTVLILHLAIADFGYLVSLAIFCIYAFLEFIPSGIHYLIISCFAQMTYMNGFFLLTAISIDRCVCVLFPIWHRCSRPKHLSPVVCAFLWVCSFLLVGIPNILKYILNYPVLTTLHLSVTAMLCLTLIIISILILFFKICLKPKHIKRGRQLVMILITLVCFLILILPLYIFVFATFFQIINWRRFSRLEYYLILSASLNSSIKPVIYFLVGRKNRAQTRESIKVIFQRLFGEEEAPESTENSTNRVSIPL